MPALRSRQQAGGKQMNPSGKQTSNGPFHQASSNPAGAKEMACRQADEDSSGGSYQLKKKLILLEEEADQREAATTKINNDSNNNNNQDGSFDDTYTQSAAKHQDEKIEVFGLQEVATSIGQSAKDQFAVALLRLQTDLEASSRRLTDLETKLDQSVQKQRQQQQQQQQQASKASKEGAKGPFSSKGNVANIIYLTWPVLVFFALRAIERRSMAAKLA